MSPLRLPPNLYHAEHHHHIEAQPDKVMRWLLVGVVAMLVLLFLEGHGWAQLKPGQQGYDPSNNAVRVNIVAGGGTGGGPSDTASSAAASESDTARQKVTSVLRLFDTGQAAGSQLVTAKGDQTNGLWVNCKTGCSAGSTTPADAFANPTNATNAFSMGALWNGTGWDRWYGDKTNGAFVQIKSSVSLAVTGTFWQATQPVSAASLPLPTGAATAAKQPALGTAGTPSADVITIQGVTSMTAVKTDGSGVTQPVSCSNCSGTVTVSGTVTANAGSGTMAVSLASLSDPCSMATAKSYAPISVTANTQLVAGVSAKKVYICSINVVAAAATNVAVVESATSGNACATSPTGIFGGSTAATGWNFAANGGIALGSGTGTVGVTATAADAVCILVSAANQVSGGISYVQQ